LAAVEEQLAFQVSFLFRHIGKTGLRLRHSKSGLNFAYVKALSALDSGRRAGGGGLQHFIRKQGIHSRQGLGAERLSAAALPECRGRACAFDLERDKTMVSTVATCALR
jgi:hypothetical protein